MQRDQVILVWCSKAERMVLLSWVLCRFWPENSSFGLFYFYPFWFLARWKGSEFWSFLLDRFLGLVPFLWWGLKLSKKDKKRLNFCLKLKWLEALILLVSKGIFQTQFLKKRAQSMKWILFVNKKSLKFFLVIFLGIFCAILGDLEMVG